MPNRYWMPFPGGSFLSIHFEGSYWPYFTRAIPGLPNLASQWDDSWLVGVELVMSKTDCGDWPPRGSRRTVGRVRRVWDGATICPNCRHVAFESNRSGMVKSEKGSDFEALRTGVRYSTLPSRYMGGALTMAGWMYCETCFLRMNLLVPPVETSATNLQRGWRHQSYSTYLQSGGIPSPYTSSTGEWCYETICKRLNAASPFGLNGNTISDAVQEVDTHSYRGSRALDVPCQDNYRPGESDDLSLPVTDVPHQKSNPGESEDQLVRAPRDSAADVPHQESYHLGESEDLLSPVTRVPNQELNHPDESEDLLIYLPITSQGQLLHWFE